MKLLLVISILLLPSICDADERVEKFATLASFAFVDYNQSAGLVTPGGKATELNPVLGKHPSRAQMLAFGLESFVALYVATELLPRSFGRVLLDSVIATEQLNIEENREVLDGRKRSFNGIALVVAIQW